MNREVGVKGWAARVVECPALIIHHPFDSVEDNKYANEPRGGGERVSNWPGGTSSTPDWPSLYRGEGGKG